MLAPAVARVLTVGELPGCGLSVVVEHLDGSYSGLHQLAEALVEPGQVVGPTTPLGRVGANGAEGSRLVWSLQNREGDALDPSTRVRRESVGQVARTAISAALLAAAWAMRRRYGR